MGKMAKVPFIAAPEAGALRKSQSWEWMRLDARGESMVVEMDKHAVMRHFHIHARDLRILDPLLSYPSAILGREHAIVLNLEHIKAIITADEVLLRNPSEGNVIPVVEELYRRLPRKHDGSLADNGSSEGNVKESQKRRRSSKSRTLGTHDIEDEPPFEFQALEVALEAICSFLDARTTELGSAAYPAFDELTAKISSRNLDRVRKLKTAMTRLTSRVQKVRDELEQLLHDDGDMAELFLTRKLASLASPVNDRATPSVSAASPSKFSRASRVSTGTYGADDDVEQVEMLLEAYFMQVDGTLNKLLALDKHRNQLIQLELLLNAGTAVLAVYAALAGIFGMNVPYTWKHGYGYMFKWVVFVAGLISFSIFTLILTYARYRGLVGN